MRDKSPEVIALSPPSTPDRCRFSDFYRFTGTDGRAPAEKSRNPACQPVIGMNEEIIFPDREFVRFRDIPAAEAMIDDE
jgi:hypothetical protein